MKSAIIIGGTSGIGRELAEKLVNNGWLVGVTGRRTELLAEIKEESGNKILVQEQDITKLESSDRSLEALFDQFDSVDLVVISSGVYALNQSLDWETAKNVIETNVLGISKVYDFVFSKFRKQGHGHLVGISSIASIRGNRFCPEYGASKAFQVNYLEALRCISKKEKLNIKITDVQPGHVKTVMAIGDNIFWVAPLKKATNQIYKGILREKRKVYVTRRWRLMAWLMKNSSSWMLEKVY